MLSKDLLTVKKGGFFVFYIDKSSPGITGGKTLFISKKMSAGMAEFKKSKKKDPKVVRGAIQFDNEKKRFRFILGEGIDTKRIKKGVIAISSNCSQLKKATFVSGVQKDSKVKKNKDLKVRDVEQNTLETFMNEFLFASPEENMSHEKAFAKYHKDWHKAVKRYNSAIKGLRSHILAAIEDMTGPDAKQHQKKLKVYSKKLKGARLEKEGNIDKYFSKLKRNSQDSKTLKLTVIEAENFIQKVSVDKTVLHLRTYRFLSIQSDVKTCLLTLEKTIAQVEAVGEEMKT